MKEIDYEKLRNFDGKRKLKAVYGYQYLPYCSLIVALKLSDWRYRDVLEFLYTNVDEFIEVAKANRIDNNDLSKMVSYWKKNNLINFDEVGIEREKISQMTVQKSRIEVTKSDNVSIFGVSYSLLDFMKNLKNKGVIVESETVAIKEFYNEFSKKYSLNELVSEYLTQQSNFIG